MQSKAQIHYRYPYQFNQYYNNFRSINPANIVSEDTFELAVGNQSLGGDFNNIGGYYAGISGCLKGKDSTKVRHSLAMNFVGEREGGLFSNSRWYLGYALRIRLNTTYALSLGFSSGLYSYLIKSTANSAGASANTFDANIGLCLSSKSRKIGLSINQFPNAKFRPLAEQLELKRYIEIYGMDVRKISHNVTLKSILHTSFQPGRDLLPDITEIIVLKNIFAIGASYVYQRQYGVLVGIEKIPIIYGNIKPYFSFEIPTNNPKVAQNSRTFSVGLNYAY